MSPTDAEELLAGLEIPGWDSTVQADMISPNWQQKADAVTLIGEKIAVSVCMYVCVCQYLCLYACMHVCVCMIICVYLCLCVYASIHLHFLKMCLCVI